LPSVQKVEVNLATDQFTVSYIADQVIVAQLHEAIKSLGYTPSTVQSAFQQSHEPRPPSIPEPVLTALSEASDSEKLVFIDFQATWCGACKIMERTTLADAEVRRALLKFVTLKVDADEDADATNYYEVVGLPTLVILDARGEEKYRHVGPISAEDLRDILERHSGSQH
jgi:thiol:disulfide interchange protein